MKHIHELALSGLADLLARRAWNELKDHEHDGEVAAEDAHVEGEGGEVHGSGPKARKPGIECAADLREVARLVRSAEGGPCGADPADEPAHHTARVLLAVRVELFGARRVAVRVAVRDEARLAVSQCLFWMEKIELHGSGRLGFHRRLPERAARSREQSGVVQLDLGRDAAGQPVLDALDAAIALVIAEQLGDLGRSAEGFDHFGVGHGVIKRHV